MKDTVFKPQTVRCALLRENELRQYEVLLVQRAVDDRYAGEWELPGGEVEAGEEPLDAVIREMKEETGIKLSKVDITANIYPTAKQWTPPQCFYAARWNNQTITCSREHTAFVWTKLPVDYIRFAIRPPSLHCLNAIKL